MYLRDYILKLQIQLMVLDLLWHVVRAAGKVAFMLVREVSDSADMMIPGRVGYY